MAEAIGQKLTLTNNTSGKVFAELIRLLQDVNTNSEMAKLNETTISDNNGGRIEL